MDESAKRHVHSLLVKWSKCRWTYSQFNVYNGVNEKHKGVSHSYEYEVAANE